MTRPRTCAERWRGASGCGDSTRTQSSRMTGQLTTPSCAHICMLLPLASHPAGLSCLPQSLPCITLIMSGYSAVGQHAQQRKQLSAEPAISSSARSHGQRISRPCIPCTQSNFSLQVLPSVRASAAARRCAHAADGGSGGLHIRSQCCGARWRSHQRCLGQRHLKELV